MVRNCFLISVICTIPFWVQAAVNTLGIQSQMDPWLQLLLATVAQFGAGWIIYKGAVDFFSNPNSWQDLIIALGSTAAYGLSIGLLVAGLTLDLYFISSSSLITFFLCGKWMEKSIENDEKEPFTLLRMEGARLANKVSSRFTIAILVLGIFTDLYWEGLKGIVYALGILIIACPSMLSLAIPSIMVVAKKMADGVSEDDFQDLLTATKGKIKQNLLIVFAFQALGIPIAMLGLLNSSIVTGTMVMSFLALAANSLLLGYWKPEGNR